MAVQGREDGRAEAVEFVIKEDSKFTNIPLSDLKLKKNTLLSCIYRNGNIIIPSGSDSIKKNDSVVFIVADYNVTDISDVMAD